jgi:hypothetical protein
MRYCADSFFLRRKGLCIAFPALISLVISPLCFETAFATSALSSIHYSNSNSNINSNTNSNSNSNVRSNFYPRLQIEKVLQGSEVVSQRLAMVGKVLSRSLREFQSNGGKSPVSIVRVRHLDTNANRIEISMYDNERRLLSGRLVDFVDIEKTFKILARRNSTRSNEKLFSYLLDFWEQSNHWIGLDSARIIVNTSNSIKVHRAMRGYFNGVLVPSLTTSQGTHFLIPHSFDSYADLAPLAKFKDNFNIFELTYDHGPLVQSKLKPLKKHETVHWKLPKRLFLESLVETASTGTIISRN